MSVKAKCYSKYSSVLSLLPDLDTNLLSFNFFIMLSCIKSCLWFICLPHCETGKILPHYVTQTLVHIFFLLASVSCWSIPPITLERDIQKAIINVTEKLKTLKTEVFEFKFQKSWSNWGNEFLLWFLPLFQAKAMTDKKNLKRYG